MSPRIAAPLVLVAAACGALAGCGGNDKSRAEEVAREFVRATDERDPKLCDELITDDLLLESTGSKGGRGREVCRKQLKDLERSQSLNLELRTINETRVDGDEANVRLEVDVDGQTREQTVTMRKVDGEFRVTGATPTSK